MKRDRLPRSMVMPQRHLLRALGLHRILSQDKVLDQMLALRTTLLGSTRRSKPLSPTPTATVSFPSRPPRSRRSQSSRFFSSHVFYNVSRVTSRPSLGGLAPVDENEQMVDMPSSPNPAVEVSSPTSARTRLESTTSSRFFPGGWFSSSTKLPEEGRTSLEIATGEFSRSISEETASPAMEVPTNTPIDGDVEHKKNGKWCVIM